MSFFSKIVLIISVTIFFLTSCGPTPKQADVYNRQLTLWQLQVKATGDSLEQAFMNFDSVQIGIALEKARVLTKRNQNALAEKGILKGDSSLYVAHREYLKIYSQVLDNEYEEMYKLYRMPDENFGAGGETKFRKLQTTKNQKIKESFLYLRQIQEEFAADYNLILKKKVQ